MQRESSKLFISTIHDNNSQLRPSACLDVPSRYQRLSNNFEISRTSFQHIIKTDKSHEKRREELKVTVNIVGRF